MLQIDGDMLNPLNYSLRNIFLARKERERCGVITPSVISVFGWLLHATAPVTLPLSPVQPLISDWCSGAAATAPYRLCVLDGPPSQLKVYTFRPSVLHSLRKVNVPSCIRAGPLLIYCAGQHKVLVINLSNWWNKSLLQEVIQARVTDPPDNKDLLVWSKTWRV